MKKALRAAFPHTLPVLAGFLCLGAAYGILMESKGFGPVQSTLFSLVAFCGSMQYAAIPLLTAAFQPLQLFALSLMVNARHLFYGISMLGKYRGTGGLKPLLACTLCDETFSIVSAVTPPAGICDRQFYLCIHLLDYLYWALGTLAGGLIGSAFCLNTRGMDFALTALFVVLFTEQIRKRENLLPGFIGLICTLLCLFLFGSGNLVLPAMGIILVALLAGRKWL